MGDEPVETLETPLETLETPLEIPLESIETQLETPAEEAPEPAKKKGGRPVGAKSKEQGKPRPKRVAANRIRARALAEEEDKEPAPPKKEETPPSDPLPRAFPGSRPIPLESQIDPRDKTSVLMMSMLRQQAAERRQRKVDVWKSWFSR